MTPGEKIRYFRINYKHKNGTIGLTQKELSKKINVAESTIRLYELGLRKPNRAKIQAIAKALNINEYAIADISIDTCQALQHALFLMEDYYNLVPTEGKLSFSFNLEPGGELYQFHKEWLEKYSEYITNKISKEDYLKWKSQYGGNKESNE